MLKRFSTFVLDTDNQSISVGQRCVQLPPKAFTVLSYLIENAGRIVGKEELLDTAWADTFVQEGALKACVLEIRKALGDTQKPSRYIETVHRRGYRFIGERISAPTVVEVVDVKPGFVGRCSCVDTLQSLWDRSTAGDRQTALITGEAGAGKTSLIRHFLGQLRSTNDYQEFNGICREHFGTMEPYYPVFEAISAKVRDDSGAGLTSYLRRYAPTWLLQMPGTECVADAAQLKEEALGSNRERMVREICEAIEEISKAKPLIFVLEDLHWSDVSTVDLISALSSRTSYARLLLILSYRPLAAADAKHPVRSVTESLSARKRCVELDLAPLTTEAVSEYIHQRFSNSSFCPQLAELVSRRTDGHPLFVKNLIEYALSREWIKEDGEEWRLTRDLTEFTSCFPETLAKLIETEAARLADEERSVLETASVAGLTFPLNLLASAESDLLHAEVVCENLAGRRFFIRSAGLTGNGCTLTARYRFAHSLYREFFYACLSPIRRMRLHRHVAERMENGLCGAPAEAASELATHYEQSRDYEKAIEYLKLLARRCVNRHALGEALGALGRAIDLANNLTPEQRTRTQLGLIEELGLVYRLAGQLDLAAAEFRRMSEKSREIGKIEDTLRAQLLLASVLSWSDRDLCLQASETAMRLCGPAVSAELQACVMGQVAYWHLLFIGWNSDGIHASAATLETARRSGDMHQLALHLSRHSFFQTLSSDYRNACVTAAEGVNMAIEMESLTDYSVGHYYEAFALLHVGEWGKMKQRLALARELVRRTGHELWDLLFGLLETLLELQACSFDSARVKCRDYLARARKLKHPLSVQTALVVLGVSELSLGDLRAARESFEELQTWQSKERILMDWIWKLQLQLGLTALCLAETNIPAARVEADKCLELASATAERTWKALAWHARATVSLSGGGSTLEAQENLARGFDCIRGFEAPLAEWRLHALAVGLSPGEEHAEKGLGIVRTLADSLGSDEPLAFTFLRSSAVADLLRSTAAASSKA